ncbi:deoxyribodipyrimidine photo-lyase type II [Achlya hypogyna]|uniref:Deoxyribodipyrimidine photo-lyase n=1 Tax=Achlya hypogyna TaxID=1202772 RepID=A0A1V9Z5X0_ACHHY|nr:deoxyribodipyrimidine photo-lyase type II [Achlya hypogyna]
MKLADFVGAGLKQDRLRFLRGAATDGTGNHVLYWMQASLRTRFNYALHAAITAANSLNQPLRVLFTVDTTAAPMSERHLAFLLEGLVDVRAALARKHIPFYAVHCAAGGPSPVDVVAAAGRKASVVVTDHPYLRHERLRTEAFVAASPAPVLQVEADVVVPVATVSKREEYSNGTIRPKINALLPQYLVALPALTYKGPKNVPLALSLPPLDLAASVDDLLAHAPDVDRSVGRVRTYLGGESVAQATLETFLADKLLDYETERNKPDKDATSNLSPYLRYGNISPVDVALRVLGTPGPEPAMTLSRNHMIDEMVVRRELAVNFCWYNRHEYDSITCLPPVATNTLTKHGTDRREYVYSDDEFEQARTHDTYWNACQLDMMATGKMQGYLRQYWGKKILEWSARPADAFAFAVAQNAKYNLDGYDPNGYAGVAWVFGKHDRVFPERPVYGTVRYMGARRLTEIFNMPAYVALVTQRCIDANLPLRPQSPRKAPRRVLPTTAKAALPEARTDDASKARPPVAPGAAKKRRPRRRKKAEASAA